MGFINKIVTTQLFRVSSLNAVSVLVRIAGGVLASKVIAVFIGPSGVALVENLRNFLNAVETFSTLGFQNGVIKYVAEKEKEEAKLQKILNTVFISIVFIITVVSVLLLFMAHYLNKYVLDTDNDYTWVFRVLAIALPLYAGNLILVAVLNGLGKFKQVIYLNIWGNIFGVLLSAVLIWQFGVAGAFLGLIISPSLLFLYSFYLVRKRFLGMLLFKKKYFDFGIVKGLLSYSLMAVVTAIASPFVHISIRNTISNDFGENEAGYWSSITRIAVFYLLFISTLLTIYFLPSLTLSKTKKDTKAVFVMYYKVIVPLFILGATIVYFLRDFIVRLLYSEEFLPMKELFFWQLLGDFFKVCALILAYQFLAKKMTKAFIVSEILSFTILYFLSMYWINIYGSEGAVMAHAATHFIYLAGLIVYFRKTLTQ